MVGSRFLVGMERRCEELQSCGGECQEGETLTVEVQTAHATTAAAAAAPADATPTTPAESAVPAVPTASATPAAPASAATQATAAHFQPPSADSRAAQVENTSTGQDGLRPAAELELELDVAQRQLKGEAGSAGPERPRRDVVILLGWPLSWQSRGGREGDPDSNLRRLSRGGGDHRLRHRVRHHRRSLDV